MLRSFSLVAALSAAFACEEAGSSAPANVSVSEDPEATLILSDPRAIDADRDGVWEPGEALEIAVAMTNLGEDDMGYPGVVLSASPAESLAEARSENWFYGIFAGQVSDMALWAQASPDARPGTEVAFTASVSRLGCGNPESWAPSCPPPAEITFTVRIGAPRE